METNKATCPHWLSAVFKNKFARCPWRSISLLNDFYDNKLNIDRVRLQGSRCRWNLWWFCWNRFQKENSCVSAVSFLAKPFLNRFDTLAGEVLWWSIVALVSINRNRAKIPFHHKGKKESNSSRLTKTVVTMTVLECTIKNFCVGF
jgi:hypothetical protein